MRGYQCDKCGKWYQFEDGGVVEVESADSIRRHDNLGYEPIKTRTDLCNGCLKDFQKWLTTTPKSNVLVEENNP